MVRTFEVKASNITVHDGTKGIKPDGADGVGRNWQAGSIVELTDSAEIDGLLKAGAIEPVGEKVAAEVEKTVDAQAPAVAAPPAKPAAAKK